MFCVFSFKIYLTDTKTVKFFSSINESDKQLLIYLKI